MQKKMKNEEFDHYIQSQFADEAITPPQQIEGAIFEAMAKNSRRKKLGVIGTGILVLGALAYGVNGTMNTAHVVTETPLLLSCCCACCCACCGGGPGSGGTANAETGSAR